MKASEARKVASDFNLNEDNSQFSEILSRIKKASEQGKFEIWYYEESIIDIVRNKLTSLGYEVGATQFERNETLTQIKW